MTGELKKGTLELVLANLNNNVIEIKDDLKCYRKENGERLERLILKLENHEIRLAVLEDRQTPASKEIKQSLFDRPYIKYPSITISAAGIVAIILEVIKYFGRW